MINKGAKIKKIKIPDKQPREVIITALCPCPRSRSLCPGRTDKKESSFGAPR